MPILLKVLAGVQQTDEVALLKREGVTFRLKCPSAIAPGTAAQLTLAGEMVLGEITTSIEQTGYFEVELKAQHVLRSASHWNLESSGGDSKESLMGSLSALNAHLMRFERHQADAGDPFNR